VWEADILHTISDRDDALIGEWQSRGRPWVSTCHIDMRTRGMAQRPTTDNWIFVSRTLARRHGRERFVLNGVDPDACIYSESKGDYFSVHVVDGLGDEEGSRHRDLACRSHAHEAGRRGDREQLQTHHEDLGSLQADRRDIRRATSEANERRSCSPAHARLSFRRELTKRLVWEWWRR
jgi:hypothetical protein